MAESGGPEAPVRVVQITSNDHPPFDDICMTYEAALKSLGVGCVTIVLSPTRNPGSGRASPSGREPAAIPGAVYLDLADLGDIRRAARGLDACLAGSVPALVICHRYRPYRILRASAIDAPRVVTIAHEFGFFRRPGRRLERVLFARRTLFAGVSPAVQAELALAVPDPLCLPNAMDFAAFDARFRTRAEALDVLGVKADGALTIGLVGRLVEKKAPRLAIEALAHLAADGHDVRLLVIGDGPLAADLRELARDLPVVFCGFVPDARELLAALDVLLLTSEAVEAFGMVALEAMAGGVPVVSPTVPGPQFVLGGSGYYYTERTPGSVAEAIARVQADRQAGELAGRLAHARERAVREFSVAALAARLDELFFHPPNQAG